MIAKRDTQEFRTSKNGLVIGDNQYFLWLIPCVDGYIIDCVINVRKDKKPILCSAVGERMSAKMAYKKAHSLYRQHQFYISQGK